LNPKFNNIYKQHRNEGRIGHTGQLEFTATWSRHGDLSKKE
jgi:hypothetical protein